MQLLIDIRLLSQGEQTGVDVYTRNIVERLITTNRQPGWHYTLFYNAWRAAPLPAAWHTAPQTRIVNWGVPNKIFDIWQPRFDGYLRADCIYSPHINLVRTRHTPRILTIHDLSFVHYPEFFNYRYRFWHWRQRIALQAREATAIITDSLYTKNDIVETLNVPPKKIHVIYPGIDTPRHSNLLKSDFNKLPEQYILFLATVEPRKNMHAAISAFALLKQQPIFKDLRLIIAGRHGWRFVPIAYPGVIYWGAATTEEKTMLYTNARAFLYPSFFEGFGFPPLEAEQYGCPVVASNRSSLPEILGDSALLVDPWRADAIADALARILTNAAARERLIAAGLKNVKRFSWHTTVCELLNIFSLFSASAR